QRCSVAIPDPFQIAVGGVAPPLFTGLAYIDTVAVFGEVIELDGIAFSVVARAGQPSEDVPRLIGIADAGFRSGAVDRNDVVPGYRTPVYVSIAPASPLLDPRKQSLDPGTILPDLLSANCFPALGLRHGHEVLGARQDEDIGIARIAILRNAL